MWVHVEITYNSWDKLKKPWVHVWVHVGYMSISHCCESFSPDNSKSI